MQSTSPVVCNPSGVQSFSSLESCKSPTAVVDRSGLTGAIWEDDKRHNEADSLKRVSLDPFYSEPGVT